MIGTFSFYSSPCCLWLLGLGANPKSGHVFVLCCTHTLRRAAYLWSRYLISKSKCQLWSRFCAVILNNSEIDPWRQRTSAAIWKARVKNLEIYHVALLGKHFSLYKHTHCVCTHGVALLLYGKAADAPVMGFIVIGGKTPRCHQHVWLYIQPAVYI